MKATALVMLWAWQCMHLAVNSLSLIGIGAMANTGRSQLTSFSETAPDCLSQDHDVAVGTKCCSEEKAVPIEWPRPK